MKKHDERNTVGGYKTNCLFGPASKLFKYIKY